MSVKAVNRFELIPLVDWRIHVHPVNVDEDLPAETGDLVRLYAFSGLQKAGRAVE